MATFDYRRGMQEESNPRERVHVAGSRVRCPYCHDDVQSEEHSWVACAGCLARHHTDCWEESSNCSACGTTERLTPEPSKERGAALTAIDSEDVQENQFNLAMGGPRRILFTRMFSGKATIEDSAWLQATVRRAVKVKGRVSLENRSLVWRPLGVDGCANTNLTVSLISKEGNTELRVEEDMTGSFGGHVGALVGGVGAVLTVPLVGALQALGLGLSLFLVIPLLFLGLFVLARQFFARHARKRETLLETLTQKLTRGLTWQPKQETTSTRRTPAPLKKEA